MLLLNRSRRVATQAQLVRNRRRQRKIGKTKWLPRLDLTGLWVWRGPVGWKDKS